MDPISVDLQAKKAEAGWLAASDRFWLAATPKLFEWLRWAVMIAAVSYVAHRGASWALQAVVAICYASLFLYYLAFFSQFQFENFPLLKSSRAQRLASVGLTSILGTGTYALVRLAVDALVAAQK